MSSPSQISVQLGLKAVSGGHVTDGPDQADQRPWRANDGKREQHDADDVVEQISATEQKMEACSTQTKKTGKHNTECLSFSFCDGASVCDKYGFHFHSFRVGGGAEAPPIRLANDQHICFDQALAVKSQNPLGRLDSRQRAVICSHRVKQLALGGGTTKLLQLEQDRLCLRGHRISRKQLARIFSETQRHVITSFRGRGRDTATCDRLRIDSRGNGGTVRGRLGDFFSHSDLPFASGKDNRVLPTNSLLPMLIRK